MLTSEWQINGSPLWPTVDGAPGHEVVTDGVNMTNTNDLCTPDVVVSEVGAHACNGGWQR